MPSCKTLSGSSVRSELPVQILKKIEYLILFLTQIIENDLSVKNNINAKYLDLAVYTDQEYKL